jgi:hypothetical protein
MCFGFEVIAVMTMKSKIIFFVMYSSVEFRINYRVFQL